MSSRTRGNSPRTPGCLRFVVTNLPTATDAEAEGRYDEYVQRGESEHRMGELKGAGIGGRPATNGLHAGRLSCHRFVANFWRLLLHAAAYNLLNALRCATTRTCPGGCGPRSRRPGAPGSSRWRRRSCSPPEGRSSASPDSGPVGTCTSPPPAAPWPSTPPPHRPPDLAQAGAATGERGRCARTQPIQPQPITRPPSSTHRRRAMSNPG